MNPLPSNTFVLSITAWNGYIVSPPRLSFGCCRGDVVALVHTDTLKEGVFSSELYGISTYVLKPLNPEEEDSTSFEDDAPGCRYLIFP